MASQDAQWFKQTDLGGVVLGLFLSRKAPSNQQLVALGGSADSLATSTLGSSVDGGVTAAWSAAPSSQTSLHVTPTYTTMRLRKKIQ